MLDDALAEKGVRTPRRHQPAPPVGRLDLRPWRVTCRLTLDILQTIDIGGQPKEAGTALGCAGDGPRDGGEAGVGRFAPQISVWNDTDGVLLALALANWFRGSHIDKVASTP